MIRQKPEPADLPIFTFYFTIIAQIRDFVKTFFPPKRITNRRHQMSADFSRLFSFYFLRPEGRASGVPALPVNNPFFSLHVWIFIHLEYRPESKTSVCMQSGNAGHRLGLVLVIVQWHRLPCFLIEDLLSSREIFCSPAFWVYYTIGSGVCQPFFYFILSFLTKNFL